MIAANGTKERVDGKDRAEQRRNILALMDHHIAQGQATRNIGKLIIELEFVRGGNVKSPYIEYEARWRFFEKVEGCVSS